MRVSNPANERKIPVVFISSTVEDLKAYREAAAFEADRAGFKVLKQEYWPARGDLPPPKTCLAEVSKADILVVMVAHRYGWVPVDQPNEGGKSITWLECNEALREAQNKEKIEVLAFLADKDSDTFSPARSQRESADRYWEQLAPFSSPTGPASRTTLQVRGPCLVAQRLPMTRRAFPEHFDRSTSLPCRNRRPTGQWTPGRLTKRLSLA